MLFNFDRETLAGTAHVPFINEETKIAPISFFTNKDNQDNLENKIIHFLVLNVTSGAKSANIKMNTSTPYGANKRTKYSKDITYNRYWICADLASPPNCFAIITRSSTESDNLLKDTKGEPFVGAEYYLWEPSTTFQTVYKTVVLNKIDTMMKRFIPTSPFNNLISTTAFMREPPEASIPYYFILNNVHISLGRARANFNVSCGGIQCDRQKGTNGCTCLHVTSTQSLVYTFDVTFAVPEEFDSTGRITVPNFSSLKTTKIFFKNFYDYSYNTDQESSLNLLSSHRQKIKSMVDFVNVEANGKWTIVGWYQKGQTTDATTEGDKIDNLNFQVHLTSVMPTNYATVIMNSMDFNAMKIDDTASPALTV